MNTVSKIGASLLLVSLLSTPAFAAEVTEVQCSTDTVYSENSCDQCFVRTPNMNVWEVVANMNDIWENSGNVSQILYKEEQKMPKMISLWGASWKETKVSDTVDFWRMSWDLDAKYSDEEEGYLLAPGESVRWLESTMGSAYQLTANTTAQGVNIGLLTYDTTVRNIVNNIPEVDPTMHRECVIFKSGEPGAAPVTPPTERLPDTGPAHVLLALVALLLGAGLFFMTRRNA